MFFYSNVPLVNKTKCPKASDHNYLAAQVNYRLTLAGPGNAWAIFYYADSIFTGMRNTATPQVPLGVNPPEDEWWKIYACIEHPTAETGEGNWPIAFAGTPEGANVMNPLNAYIFGRKTAENKITTQMGPWAEGNLFDGLVESSRSILNNSSYWQDSFRQRGAFKTNANYNSTNYRKWRSGEIKYKSYAHLSHTKYLPSRHDPVHVSNSLFVAGRSSDRYFNEYASNTVYMRYPPAVYGGSYTDWQGVHYPEGGILKRKNAAKDILQWALWAYTFYFRGSELQRSLFCEKKSWDAPVIDFSATKRYRGQQTFGLKRGREEGPLNICDVGFDFFQYYTRQNILAPALGINLQKKGTHAVKFDSIGNPILEQYRPTFKFEISAGKTIGTGFLGLVNGKARRASFRNLSVEKIYSIGKGEPETNYPMAYENYDNLEIGELHGGRGGKALRFPASDAERADWNKDMLFNCSYEPSGLAQGGATKGLSSFDLTSISSKSSRASFCLAGYYLQTTAIGNSSMSFKLRIWKNKSIIHEALINRRYSYAVNRKGKGEKAYIFNKLFYFKNPVTSGMLRFEIVPFADDTYYEDMPDTVGSNDDPAKNPKSIAKTNYGKRIKREKGSYDKVICFGNPFSETILAELPADIGTPADDVSVSSDKWLYVPSGFVGAGDSKLSDGDAVRIWSGESLSSGNYINEGIIYFVGVTGLVETGSTRKQIFLSHRQDSRVGAGLPKTGVFDLDDAMPTGEKVIVIEKMKLPDNFFSASLEPAILLKQRPSFQDVYALLRVATEKQNERNTLARTIGADSSGVGTVGHAFSESNRVFHNYIKYGSGLNLYGSSVVPALKQKVSSNPIYESIRKFVSSYLRMADRRQLINYTIEGGKGVLYFRRYAWMGLGNRSKATVLRNIEPNIDACGRFYDDNGSKNITDLSTAQYKPIQAGKKYLLWLPRFTKDSSMNEDGYLIAVSETLKYNGQSIKHRQPFTGVAGKTFLESGSLSLKLGNLPSHFGAYEIDGITLKGDIGSAGVSNEWTMFMTASHYHPSSSHIYKPSVYNDIMGFLNNRCHHRSYEYERSSGKKYDMIRTELCRVMPGPRNEPGPRMHIFLSNSPPNFNYIFNTNSPEHGNLETYGERDFVSAYRKSCPAVAEKPYKVVSCKVVNSMGQDLGSRVNINPTPIRDKNMPKPAQIIRVELDRPLRGTGRLGVGSSGWANINKERLTDEPYRTDENAVIEYLMHTYLGREGYNCKRMMIGDYGAKTNVHEGIGYRPFGACFPRFYFMKLIPYVSSGSLLDVEPYAQMDFYLRAICGQFVMPYNYYNAPGQVNSINWKFTELASRSAEEDPTSYYYVDPRETQS